MNSLQDRLISYLKENFDLDNMEVPEEIREYIKNTPKVPKPEVLSRKAAEKLALSPFFPNTALISIRDTDAEALRLKNRPQWMLSVAFDDIYWDEIDDYEEDFTFSKEKEEQRIKEAAQKIADFVADVCDKAEKIICQCEYGQSRSAAVAAAVREYFYKDGIEIFADDRYCPNKLVFRLTLEALRKKELK